jgi:hypothetical protein
VDLHGLADDGREIFAQVTYHPRGSSPVEKIFEALKPYGERGAPPGLLLPWNRTQP